MRILNKSDDKQWSNVKRCSIRNQSDNRHFDWHLNYPIKSSSLVGWVLTAVILWALVSQSGFECTERKRFLKNLFVLCHDICQMFEDRPPK